MYWFICLISKSLNLKFIFNFVVKTPGTFSRNQPASVSAVRTPINGKITIHLYIVIRNEYIYSLYGIFDIYF